MYNKQRGEVGIGKKCLPMMIFKFTSPVDNILYLNTFFQVPCPCLVLSIILLISKGKFDILKVI